MITDEQAKTLKLLILNVRETDELQNRFYSGYTNKSATEVQRECKASADALSNFINEITEK